MLPSVSALAPPAALRHHAAVRLALVALLLAAAGPACRDRDSKGGDSPAIAPVDPDQLRRRLATPADIARLTDRSLGAYRRAAEALEAAGGNCDQAARALRSIVAEDGQAIARAKALSELPDLVERARPVLLRRAERTRLLTARFDAATSRCFDDARVARWLRAF